VNNLHRKHKEQLQNLKNYKYKGRTKQCLSLKRLTNKTFRDTTTKCVRLSEIFRTSYPLFYIVVFRETTSTGLTTSVLFLLFCRIVSERNS